MTGAGAPGAEATLPRPRDLADFLDRLLDVAAYPGDRGNGLRADAPGEVRRLGLALEPAPGLAARVRRERVDALLLHRVGEGERPPGGTALLAYHLPLDDRLSVGYNPRLAAALGLRDPEPMGSRRGYPLGMVAGVEPVDFEGLLGRVSREFGGVEATSAPAVGRVSRVAVVGAMTDALVREAAARGAGVYVTGQLRAPARAAVRDTGVGVLATGHRRAEVWALRALAAILRERWPRLRTRVLADP